MSEITRRSILIGAGLGGAALAVPAFAHAQSRPALAVYDSRLPQSLQFAAECKAKGIKLFDIADQESGLWRACRDGFGVGEGDTIIGMTAWSDWVALRGLLHEQQRRVRSESRVEAGGRSLFSWSVA
jgi:hypothetical protein